MHSPEYKLVEIGFQDRAEVVICGSSLFACQMALESAQAGRNTVLAMERLHPFHEAIHCLNPWVARDRSDTFPELLDRTLGNPDLTRDCGQRTYFNATEAAIEIEDRLCDAGVRIHYNAPVAGALTHAGQLGAVVFGGKPGLYAVEGALIIDATPHASLACALGLPTRRVAPAGAMERVHYSIERSRGTPYDNSDDRFQAANGLDVLVENRHLYTHFTMSYPARPWHPLIHAQDYRDIYAAALEYSPNLPAERFRGADGYLRQGFERIDAVDGAVAAFGNLRIFSPWSLPDNREGQLALLRHELLFAAYPRELRADVLATLPAATPPDPRPQYCFRNDAVAPAGAEAAKLEHRFTDPDAVFPGMHPGNIRFVPPQPAPPRPLTIVGAGTSGVAAAIQAAALRTDAVCIDAGAELGGAATIGGVTNLWYGNKTKGFAGYYRKIGADNDGLNAPPFFRAIAGQGDAVSPLLLTPVCGVALEGRNVRAIHVITPWGLTAVGVEHVIDATGDGSLAAWAGCEHHFGSARDELTLWASLGSYHPGNPEARRQFLTPLDERNPEDIRRVVQAMRRFKRRGPAPAFLLMPRESRHIHAVKRVTFLDTMAGRRFKDGILRFRSNLDLKGNSSSDLAHGGLLSQERFRIHEVTLPYAAMTPAGLDNLLVAGKAYDCTSDALGMARMQRDLAMMGRAAAHAMRQCIEDGIPTHAIALERLQEVLVREGIMQAADAAADDLGISESREQLLQAIAAAANLEQSLEPTARLILLEQSTRAPAPVDAAGAGPSMMRYLGLRKDERCIAACRQALQAWLENAGGTIPERDRMPDNLRHLLPDHGFAPLPLYWLMMLAQSCSDEVAPACTRIAGLMAGDDTMRFNTLWAYTFAIAYCCERVATPDCINALETLLDTGRFDAPLLRRGADLRQSLDTQTERLSYLRLCLLRALARCGSPRGYAGLIDYLQSAHSCYARNARAELQALTRSDFLFDTGKWQAWLKQHHRTLQPQPFDRHLD